MKAIRRIALVGVACLVVATASCLQNRSNQVVALADQLIDNSEKLLELLKSIKDPASAQASIPKIPDAYGHVFPLVRELVASANAADRRGGVTLEAQRTLERRVADFQSISKQIEEETSRIRQIRGLPAEFWDVLRVEGLKSLLLIVDSVPTGLSPENLAYVRSVSQMLSDYGPQKVVLVELEGSSPASIEELFDRITSIAGADAKIVKLSTAELTDVTVGPVDDFDALAAAIDFGKAIDMDPAQRMIVVKLASTTPPPGTEVNAPQPQLGNSPTDRFHSLDSNSPGVARPDRTARNDLRDRMSPEDMRTAIESFVGDRQVLPSSSDPEYHQKLCDLMVDDRSWHLRDDVIDALLRINPRDIQDKDVRQQIARSFRELALDDMHPHEAGKAIRGLVLYGGKYSVPILIDRLRQERLRAPHEIFDGLAAFPSEEGAEALVERLGDIFNHQAAVSALRRMGPVAEDALMNAAPSDNPDVSLAAVKLLGDVGTTKCVSLLSKATRSSNPVVSQTAKSAIKEIRERTMKAAE